MKKIKKKKIFEVRERWIKLADAEKCPECGFPFQGSIEFSNDSAALSISEIISSRVFICLRCDKGFEQYKNGLKEIIERSYF